MADEATGKRDDSLANVAQHHGGLTAQPTIIWPEIPPQQTHVMVRANKRHAMMAELDPSFTPAWYSIENPPTETSPVPFNQIAFHTDEWAASFRLIQSVTYDAPTNTVTVRYITANYLFDVWKRDTKE